MASISTLLDRVKDGSISLIDREAVGRACVEAKHEWRDRCLDPFVTLEVFVAQIAHGNAAISFLARRFDGAFSESAYCQARARLPVAVVRAATDAFNAKAAAAVSHTERELGSWRGHRTVILDGSGILTPDTPPLRERFGTNSHHPPGCGLPCMSVLAVFDARTDLLLGMDAAKAQAHDAGHAHKVLPLIKEGDVAVGDRGLCAFTLLHQLKIAGAHGVFRMSATRAMPFPAKRGERERHSYNRHRKDEPLLVTLHSANDQVVEIVKPHNRPEHMTPKEFASVPAKMLVRAVRYRVEEPGFRSREITLMTDLLDAEKYPAKELAELYLSRWRIEVNFRHLKRTMGMYRLKCQSVEGVQRELLIFALVYNAVCTARCRAAASRGVALRRVSFIDALRWMLIDSVGAPTELRQPPDLKLWPIRPPRVHPRQLKQGDQSFRVMRKPRDQLVRECLARTEEVN